MNKDISIRLIAYCNSVPIAENGADISYLVLQDAADEAGENVPDPLLTMFASPVDRVKIAEALDAEKNARRAAISKTVLIALEGQLRKFAEDIAKKLIPE